MVSWRTTSASAVVVGIAYFAAVAGLISRDEDWLGWVAVGLTLALIALGAVLLVRVRLRSVGVGILIGTAVGFLSFVVFAWIALSELGKSTY